MSINFGVLFDVEHDAKKPFIVNTSHVQVRVLGTSFNVKAFEDQSKHRIALASGQVEVSPSRIENRSNDKIIIFPGQEISYNLSSRVFDTVDDFSPELEYGSDLTKADSGRILDATIAAITTSLEAGEPVSLIGFGTFENRHRNARAGKNPQTGETIQIAASNTVGFKPGKALKTALN